jgi:DNA-binding IclR family transcriptional regulator
MLPEIGRPVNVGVPDLDNAISVERLDLLGRMVFSSPFGKRVPYHAGTLGKAILAFADESLRMRILGSKLARFTERTITDPEKLEIELAETRRLGFSKNRAEFREGGYAVGVPLLNSKGIPVGALSTPASEEEMAPANHVVRSLVNLGRSISAQLGHTDGAGFE